MSNYGQLEFYANIGGTSQNSGSTQTRDTNWHHYAVVYDDSATTLTIYRDGSQTSQNTSFTLDINASSMQGGFFAIGLELIMVQILINIVLTARLMILELLMQKFTLVILLPQHLH